jgi:hypothetical protein
LREKNYHTTLWKYLLLPASPLIPTGLPAKRGQGSYRSEGFSKCVHRGAIPDGIQAFFQHVAEKHRAVPFPITAGITVAVGIDVQLVVAVGTGKWL